MLLMDKEIEQQAKKKGGGGGNFDYQTFYCITKYISVCMYRQQGYLYILLCN